MVINFCLAVMLTLFFMSDDICKFAAHGWFCVRGGLKVVAVRGYS